MEPTIGRIVHYRLGEGDVLRIEADRAEHGEHRGNHPCVGDTVPLLVIRVWPHEYDGSGEIVVHTAVGTVNHKPHSHYGINGQAFLDGNDSLWVCSAPQGDWPGSWNWPTR